MAIKIKSTNAIDDSAIFYGDGSNLTGLQPKISVSDDTSSSSSQYITFVSNTVSAGSLSVLSVSKTNKLLTFTPSTGNLVVGGTITASSDKKLKTNIKTIDNALEKVISLRGVEYDRVDTGEHQIGVIAQEVEEVIPDVVYPKGSSPDYETKSVAYGNIVALLIEAIKEQNIRIEELEKRLGDN